MYDLGVEWTAGGLAIKHRKQKWILKAQEGR